jgi:hypothetical protein
VAQASACERHRINNFARGSLESLAAQERR